MFKPKHPEKYVGDATKIYYRSRIELRYMQYIDQHDDIIEWCSEEVVVPYYSQVDKKSRRYFPDLLIKKRAPDGTTKTVMIELKHSSETKKPAPVKKTRRALREVQTWILNSDKWNAAQAYCADRGWEFVVLTEKELGKAY